MQCIDVPLVSASAIRDQARCKPRCIGSYLAGSQHVSRLHVQRASLLRRQVQLCRPALHARADDGYQVVRQPRCNAVPVGV